MTVFETRDGLLIVRLNTDRLDAAAAPAFKADLQANIEGAPDRAIIDATQVRFLDSTGLGVFVSFLKMMGGQGVLAIAGAQPAVLRLLSITQLDKIFRLFDTVADAEHVLRR